jgi:hypothetical protein
MMDGKRGLFKKLGRMSGWKELPSEYLAYLYGLAPLGDDLANGLNKLAWMRVKGFRMSMVLKSSQTRRESIFQVGGVIQNGTGGFFNPSTLQQRWNGSREITAKVGYRFDLPAWFLDNSPTLAPFSTAYELAPYSFVLDWFLPVGNWLGALESAQYSPFFKEGFEQVFVRDRYDYRGFGFQNRTANMAFLRLESGYQEYGFLRRQLQTVPPSVITTLPALNPLPGLHQAAQGLALLTQAFKRWR